jgi:hypothetical protein
MHSHFTMTFPLFHFTTLMYLSHPHHSLLPHTLLHFTAFFDDFPTPSLHLIYDFLNPFPILLGLQERVPKASAGNWIQS